MTGQYLPDILILLFMPLLLVASGFFSGTETALFSLSTHQRARLKQGGTMVGRTITTLLAETRSLLITLLMGNMTVNVLYLSSGTMLVYRLEHEHEAPKVLVLLASVLPLILLILFGEILPKLVAAKSAPVWSRISALPMLIIHRTLSPARRLLNVLVITPLARLIAPQTTPPELSSEELESLLNLSAEHGIINADEEEMLQGVLGLSQLKVRDIMTHRVDVVAHDLSRPPRYLVDVLTETHLTHVPVYRDDLDNLVGVVHAREILLERPVRHRDLKKLIRTVHFVPELTRVDQLLRELRRAGTTFAMAVDEYGGTAGLVTLEDVVEELVGDIAGPYVPAADSLLTPVGEHRWRVSAQLPIHDWTQVFGPTMAPPGLSTVGGLVMARLRRVPRVGDRTALGNVQIEVEQMQGQRIETLLLNVVIPGAAQPQEVAT